VVSSPAGAKLVINKEEAQGVDRIFDLYRKHQALIPTLKVIQEKGWTNKGWVTEKGMDCGGSEFDKGTLYALQPDMAVIAPGGVVGRVVIPTLRSSKVQLLVDRNAAVGALIERSRAQGVAMGSGDQRLKLEYVSETADVVVGDQVVTSGIDGIFPKGFTIGSVDVVEKSGPSYKRITIKPAVDFSSLEEVLVVLTPTPIHQAEGGRE